MQPTARRRHPLRPFLIAAASVLVLGLAGAIVLGAALNPVRLGDTLRQAVRRQTGRELTVNGGVHLRFGLSPEFVVEDVALANLPGGSRPQMLTAKRIRARLALLPLLGGDAVISAVTLEQPDLLLERVAGGAANWQMAPERRALYQGHGLQGGGGRHSVEIQSLALDGGQITWRPAAGDPLTFGIDRLLITASSADAPMSLAFSGNKAGAPLTIKASSGSLQRLEGGPISALAGAWPLAIDAAAEGATLHVEGGINHPDQARGYTMRVSFAAPALDRLNAFLPKPALPKLADITATALFSDGGQGELRTAQLAFHAGASDLSGWVAGLSLKQAALSAPGPGQVIQLNVDGTYQDQPLRAVATAMQPDVIGSTGPIQVDINAQAAGATLAAKGTLPRALDAAGLDMAVSLRAPELSALSPFAGRTLPAAHDLALDAQLSDAGVKLRGIALRNLSLASSLGDATGELTLVWSPRLTIAGKLDSHSLNLDGIAPAAATGGLPAIWPPPSSSAEAAAPAPPAISPSAPQPPLPTAPIVNPLPLAQLRSMDIDLDLAAADVMLAAKHYTDVQAHLQLNDGKLALNPLRAEAPEGAIIGGISLDASSDQPPIAVTLRSPSIAAEAVASALGYPGGATGTMQVNAELSGVGQTRRELQSTLSGHLGLAMVGGQVNDSLVQGLLGDALNTAGVQTLSGGSSQVRCFALLADFAHGEGTIKALAADTSRLALGGDGRFSLVDNTADLHLRPRVRLGPTEIAAPVSLRGPFGQMRATLDPVMNGGRFGLTIGGAPQGNTNCTTKLALARGGLGGPIPTQTATPADPNQIIIRKPKDLLQGLFH